MANTSYSQCGEDIIVDFLLTSTLGITDITYLDLGSNDPVDLNNTYYFYLKGSKGVSIDANPSFKSAYKEYRPKDNFVCSGVGPADTKSEFFVIDPHTLSTFSKEEAERYVATGHHRIVRVENKKILSVATILRKYFKKQAPNLLTIDVEGYDYEILSSIDFSAWRPAVICAETLTYTTDASEQKINKIIDFLIAKDYKVYADTYINTVFVDKRLWDKR